MDRGFIKKLIELIKAEYSRSKGKTMSWDKGSLLVQPFKKSRAEFLISDDHDAHIIREDDGFDWEAGGSNTAIVYFPQAQGQFATPELVLAFLKECVGKYVRDEQEFYDEGLDIGREWSASEEEAVKMAKIIYDEGFLKELGIKTR